MEYEITRFQKWLLKRITKKIIRQRKNIIIYYKILNDAYVNEFTEDSRTTINDFLIYCFNVSCKKEDQR